MRYMREVPSGNDKEVFVPEFRLNKRELELILTATQDLFDRLPKKFMFSVERNRLKNIINVSKRYLEENN